MPIRTNRGRAAVYRRLWGWPMRSPRHLTVVVFVVAVVVIAAGVIIPQVTGSNGPTPGAAAGTTGSTTSAPGATGGTPTVPGVTGGATTSMQTRITPTETPTSAPAAPAALQVADQWGRAWVNHPQGTTVDQWLTGLRPFTTEEQLTEMATVEPANIAATEVTGEPQVVNSYTSSIEVRLPTNAGELLITLIERPDGWRVTYYEQVER